MFRPFTRPALALGRRHLITPHITACPWHRSSYTTTSGKVTEPLRILFCGSDAFSTESLHALHEEWQYNRELVDHVEVCCLPPKAVGRGFKTRVVVPAMRAAESLGLDYHEVDTFKDFDLPKGINLIVAVSFGLFVPKRLLRAAKYGGLNVHPSFLPDLRGPAPIQHAMLRGDTHMGASLQTMDEEKFDHGAILAQTPAPGIPIVAHPTLNRTTRKLAMEGAELLVQGLRDGVHIAPHVDVGWKAKELEGDGSKPVKLQHAPKITKADTEIDWLKWTPEDWTKRLQLLQAVWTLGHAERNKKGAQATLYHRRILFHDAKPIPEDQVLGKRATIEVISLRDDEEVRFRKVVAVDNRSGAICLMLYPGTWIRIRRATLEGKIETMASAVAARLVVDWENSKKAPNKKEVKEETKKSDLDWREGEIW